MKNKNQIQVLHVSNLYFILKNIARFDSEADSEDLGVKSVLEEKLKILKNEEKNQNFEGLRIMGLKKTYDIANKCCGSRSVKALKEVYIL